MSTARLCCVAGCCCNYYSASTWRCCGYEFNWACEIIDEDESTVRTLDSYCSPARYRYRALRTVDPTRFEKEVTISLVFLGGGHFLWGVCHQSLILQTLIIWFNKITDNFVSFFI